MKLSSAIVEVVVDLARLKEKNAIQVETEKAKLRQMGTSERLELLLATKDDVIFIQFLSVTVVPNFWPNLLSITNFFTKFIFLFTLKIF